MNLIPYVYDNSILSSRYMVPNSKHKYIADRNFKRMYIVGRSKSLILFTGVTGMSHSERIPRIVGTRNYQHYNSLEKSFGSFD